MAKKTAEILEGDYLDFRLKVERTWPDGRVTVLINDVSGHARKVTVKRDSGEIVAHHKPD